MMRKTVMNNSSLENHTEYSPITHHGRPWRIGYLEGGYFINYPLTLSGVIKGLIKRGWIEEVVIPEFEGRTDTRQMWNWLSKNVKSKYLQFPGDAYWSAEWNEKLRERHKEEVLHRLEHVKDIDLMIAMGTWAGQDLANTRHSVPTIVMTTSDPIQAGIIKSSADSGYDHVHARCDPQRNERQIRAFHNMFEFNKLGLVYENTPAGKSGSRAATWPCWPLSLLSYCGWCGPTMPTV